jgi:hypothetical protein
MNTTTTKIAGEAMTDERATFNEFRAALCRMNDANTPVSVADRVMILSNATFLLDEYARALLASKQAAPMHPTEAMLNAARDWSLKKYGQGIGSDAAIGCWQAMLATSPTAPAQSCGDAEQADAPQKRPETTSEHIARDIREGRFPQRSEPQMVEQADEAVTLQIMRAAFRVVETEGDPDPDKQRFHLRFTFRSMRELDAACDEWRAFSNAARAKDSK